MEKNNNNIPANEEDAVREFASIIERACFLAHMITDARLTPGKSDSCSRAWAEGAAAAWFESGIRQHGDSYPTDNPTFIPFSLSKKNPYLS